MSRPKKYDSEAVIERYTEGLISSHKNFSATYIAEHNQNMSHDAITRLLREEIKADLVWKKAKKLIVQSAEGFIVFDDTVIDKTHSKVIEGVRRQYSGNEGGVIRGIGLVTAVYIEPESNDFWVIDCRVFNPEADGKSKLEHVKDMLLDAVEQKKLNFSYVLMDTWYATEDLMLYVNNLGKIFYCPIKVNRLIKLEDEDEYKAVREYEWDKSSLNSGININLKGTKMGLLKLFKVEASTSKINFVVTNSPYQQSTEHATNISAKRWKIEQAHRELKQLTGIEKCQARSAQAQKTHIICAILAWLNIKELANRKKVSVYNLKEKLYSDYLKNELKNPSIPFTW